MIDNFDKVFFALEYMKLMNMDLNTTQQCTSMLIKLSSTEFIVSLLVMQYLMKLTKKFDFQIAKNRSLHIGIAQAYAGPC